MDGAVAVALCAYLGAAAAERADGHLELGQLGDNRAPVLSPGYLLERSDQTWAEAVSVFKQDCGCSFSSVHVTVRDRCEEVVAD